MTLGIVAAADARYRKELLPALLSFLRYCRPSDVPKFGEHILPAADKADVGEYRRILESRIGELAPAMRKRVEKLLKGLPR